METKGKIKSEITIVTCKIGTKSYSFDIRDYCGGCRFRYTHRGDHWTTDVVRCDCPITLRKGGRVEIIETPTVYTKLLKKEQ